MVMCLEVQRLLFNKLFTLPTNGYVTILRMNTGTIICTHVREQLHAARRMRPNKRTRLVQERGVRKKKDGRPQRTHVSVRV
jgi:hypothetical protein